MLVGDPKLCICSFTSKEFNIYTLLSGKTPYLPGVTRNMMTLSKLISEMKKLGWTMGVLQFPPALHLDVTGLTTKTGVIDEFIKV